MGAELLFQRIDERAFVWQRSGRFLLRFGSFPFPPPPSSKLVTCVVLFFLKSERARGNQKITDISMKERRASQKLSSKSIMDPNQNVKCKIVVVGDTQCGKTALLHVFAKDCFPEVSFHPPASGISRKFFQLRPGCRRDGFSQGIASRGPRLMRNAKEMRPDPDPTV